MRSMHENVIIKPLLCMPSLQSSVKDIKGEKKKKVLGVSEAVEGPSSVVLLTRKCLLYLVEHPSVILARRSQCLTGIRGIKEGEEVDIRITSAIGMDAGCPSSIV